MSNYQPKTYRDEGGDRQIIASGGKIKVQSGGELETVSGAIVDIQSGTVMTTTAGVGTANSTALVTAVEHSAGAGLVHQTVLTLASTPISVVGASGVGFGGVKCYDFPAGQINILGSVAALVIDVSGDGIADTGSGDIALGTVILDSADLTGATDYDLGGTSGGVALTDPFVAGIGNADVLLGAAAIFDGTSTAKDAILNCIIDDADIAGTEVALFSGTWTLTWINLGDV